MNTLRASLILLCAAIVCSGCPAPVMDSIVGTWEAVGITTSPPEYDGFIDGAHYELFADGTATIVPGTGIGVGTGLDWSNTELTSLDMSYTFTGQNARVIISFTLLLEGIELVGTHVFQLRVTAPGELSGTRTASGTYGGVPLNSIEYDESWILVSKSTGLEGKTELNDFSIDGTLPEIIPQASDAALFLADLGI